MGIQDNIVLGSLAANALVGFLAGLAPIIAKLMAGGDIIAEDQAKLDALEAAEWIETGSMRAALDASIAAREAAEKP